MRECNNVINNDKLSKCEIKLIDTRSSKLKSTAKKQDKTPKENTENTVNIAISLKYSYLAVLR